MGRSVFTEQGIETMRAMAENGDHVRAIALAIGSTPASVRVKCCQLKIKLPRHARANESDNTKRSFVITIPPAEFDKLAAAAELRNCSPPVLAKLIVTLVLRDNLVDGVLDDGVEK